MKIRLQREEVSRIRAAPPLGGRPLAMLVGDCVNVCEKTPNCLGPFPEQGALGCVRWEKQLNISVDLPFSA